MKSKSNASSELATRLGIVTEYENAWGETKNVSDATVDALVHALGYEKGTTAASLEARQWERLVDPVVVVEHGATRTISAHVSLDEMVRWTLELEDGTSTHGELRAIEKVISARNGTRVRIDLPLAISKLPLGYHRLRVEAPTTSRTAECSLVVAPTRAFAPDAWARGKKDWAVTLQLYSLRSSRNWGIGDFTDLATLSRAAAKAGANAVGLNPLHTLFPSNPLDISPYSPSSRSYLNPVYIDVTAVPEFAESREAQELVETPDFKRQIETARASEQVDYALVWKCKQQALWTLFQFFRATHFDQKTPKTDRARAFISFRKSKGDSLRSLAVFEAIQDARAQHGESIQWRQWPKNLRSEQSAEVTAFVEANEERVLFSEYLQWEADRQLGGAAAAARAAGMSTGLYRDIAVGVNPHGADAWSAQTLLAPEASVGAPPDIFNPNGQDWGLAPLNPHAMRERAYAPFIEVVRANMRHAGAVRIDHVLGLKRMWWVAGEGGPATGAYVQYPMDDLLGIITLESHRNRCFVVGEDLGTVPSGFRESMERRGILSYRLLMFERKGPEVDAGFSEPAKYPSLSAAAISTHDLATLKGMWLGHDLRVRQTLKLYPSGESAKEDVDRRTGLKAGLLDTLARAGLLEASAAAALLKSPNDETFLSLSKAVHAFLSSSESKFLLVQIEDLLGQLDQMNVPGTVNEHPNWRRKLSVDVERVFDLPTVREVISAIKR